MKKNTSYILIVTIFTAFAILAGVFEKAYASDCESNYGGGETCIINKSFSIEKYVRLEGEYKDKPCKDWPDEVTIDLTDDDENDKYIEFCIRVKNLTDEDADMDFDDMKVKDSLPDELKRMGGDDLTEEWDDFEPGESKDFKIKVEIRDHEKEREGEYEKCVVNKAKLYWDDESEGADTATVCWKNYDKEIQELPKTGEPLTLGFAGLLLAVTGAFLKKKNRVEI